MKNSKQLLKIVLTLGATALLTACGASNQVASSDFSSRTTETDAASKPLAYCNEGSGTSISFKTKIYSTSRMDLVYARLTKVPTNFEQNNNYIAMWKWLANSSGYTYLDQTPLQFIIVNSNGQALTGWMKTLRWSDVESIAADMDITTATEFFNSVSILVDLKDVNGEYDVLKITNYDKSSNTAINSTDALLPMFYASPVDYAYESNGLVRANVLRNLHPYKDLANQGYTATQFQSMANSFCF